MKKGGGKQKGAEFERYVCRRLSLWVSRGKREDVFWRSAMSGGRATLQGDKNLTQAGDISAVDPLGAPLVAAFLIECKFYQDLNIIGMFGGAKNGLPEFWSKCAQDAGERGKSPMVVARQNHFGEIVCLDAVGASKLGLFVAPLPVASFFARDAHLFFFGDFLHYANRP